MLRNGAWEPKHLFLLGAFWAPFWHKINWTTCKVDAEAVANNYGNSVEYGKIHPQVIEKLKAWAEDKDNVIIVEGDWYDSVLNQTYDGIFLDTYEDEHWDKFKEFALLKANSGANVTYFDNGWMENEHGFDNISYDYLPVKPEEEGNITTEDLYQMPKVVI